MPTRKPELFHLEWGTTHEHAALTASTTTKLYKVPAGKKLRVDRVMYINPAGLAADGTNAFALEIRNGATVVATVFNTDSGDAGGAALAADTFVDGVLSATEANRVLSATDVLSAVFTEDGTQTLPAGRLVLEGRLI